MSSFLVLVTDRCPQTSLWLLAQVKTKRACQCVCKQ